MEQTVQDNATSVLQVAILGAGAAGLCMAIRLKKAGIDNFVLYEKSDRVAGTWRDNTYPGSGCDVPSHLYSYSFEPKADWSRKFALQPEIQDYFESCTDKYGLRSHIHFHTEIISAVFDEGAALWRLKTADGQHINARILISGVGQLNRPFVPELEGLDSFGGEVFHSARWNHDVRLEGKKIAVIGSGASAIQFVPEIAPAAREIVLFQRTPNWVIPKPDRPYRSWEIGAFRNIPLLLKLHRWLIYLTLERNFLAFRQEGWFGSLFRKAAMKEMEAHIEDPEERALLTPDYPVGCKRILLSNDWFPTLARDNVHVVAQGIRHVTARGVVDEEGHLHEADVIVFGTGFETTTFLAPMNITGLNGKNLNQAWEKGAEAYKGITLSGFPNFFMMYGPNTNLGHNSIIFMLECQTRYIMRCLKTMKTHGADMLDVKAGVQSAFNRKLQNNIARSVWAGGCNSWYKNEEGKVTNNWSGFTLDYWRQTRKTDLEDYALRTAGTPGNS